MSFFDDVSLPQTPKDKSVNKSSSSGSFFDSVVLPRDQEVANRNFQATQDANTEIAKNTGFWNVTKNAFSAAGDLFKSGVKAITPTDTSFSNVKEALKPSNLAMATNDTVNSIIKPFTDPIQNRIKSENAPVQSGTFIDAAPEPVGIYKVAPAVKAAVNDEADRFIKLIKSLDTNSNETPLTKLANAGKVGVGGLNIAFSPVSGLISAAEDNPITGPVAKGVNLFFGKLGELGGWEADTVIDSLPISDTSKETIRPLAQELSGLLNQVAVGKLGEIAHEKVMGRIKEVRTEIQKNLSVKSETPAQSEVKINGETSVERYNRNKAIKDEKYNKFVEESNKEYFDKNPNPQNIGGQYESYVPPDQLPVIDYGKSKDPASDGLSVIQTGETAAKALPGMKYEPIPQETLAQQAVASAKASMAEKPVVRTPAPVAAETAAKVQETIKADPTESVVTKTPAEVPVGERAVSKLSSDIAEKIKQDLGELPEYATMNMVDQANKALDLLKTDMERAKRIAMGTEQPPVGLREGSVFTALREDARARGDVQTLIDLSKSNLASEASALGQRIKAYDTFRDPTDPVKAIQDVRVAREKNIKGNVEKIKGEETQKIKAEIKKNAPTKQAWESFISEIQCKY